jgi:hypothetical protein
MKETNQMIASFEIFNNKEFIFDHQIFIDEKPTHYDFANKTKTMTGDEVLAIFN